MIGLLATMLVSVLIMILGRYVPFIPPFLWTMEVVQFSMVWMIFLGTAVGLREKEHFFVDIFPKNICPLVNGVLRIFYFFVAVAFSYIYIVYGSEYFFGWNLIQKSEIMQINMGIVYFSVPLCGINCLIFTIAEILEQKSTFKKG
jgi:TRAP-type C4-dicarboxylate transport system permease small subunit